MLTAITIWIVLIGLFIPTSLFRSLCVPANGWARHRSHYSWWHERATKPRGRFTPTHWKSPIGTMREMMS